MYQSLPRTKRSVAKLLLLCSIFHLCLGISGQSTGRVTPKINLSAKNVTITDVFKAIKSQTGKIVWFMNEEVNADKKVTVNFENASLDEVMKTLFGAASDFTWSFDNEKVILRKKKQNEDNVITSGVEPSSVRVDSLPNTITVTGKVTDEKGSPIIGATVVVKGTRVGTTTGVDGGFALEATKGKGLLTISSVGYLTRDLLLHGKSNIGNISLAGYVGRLDETVVIAYGTTTTRLSTGNTATIKSSDIEKQPVNNPLLALQGRVSGLFVTQSSGLPGSGVTVRIQGQNSIAKGNDPLYVVDGVPYSSQLLPTLNGIMGGSGASDENGVALNGNPLSFINPSDIESIDVLKDADATSIYGSRAANGAILITTKKGKVGQSKLNMNVQRGVGRVINNIKLLNTKEYLDMRKEAYLNDNLPIPNSMTTPTNSDYDLTVWDQIRNTDWQKELIGGKAVYSDAQASISGGSTNTQFIIGVGYHRETSVFPGSFEDNKGSLHFNINNTSANQKFRVQFSGNYLTDYNKLPSNDLTADAINLPPNAPLLYDKNGAVNWDTIRLGSEYVSTWINPLAYLNNQYSNHTSNLLLNANISYQILPGLDVKSSFGYTNLQSEEKYLFPLSSTRPELRKVSQRNSLFGRNYINSWIIEPQLNYKLFWGKGIINVLIGSTINQNKNDGQQISASGFNSDLVLEDIRSATYINAISSTIFHYKYVASFGRLNYNWNDKYVLSLTARRDGSSRFGPENRYHNFASIAGAWIFSNEIFFKKFKPILSYGKFRISYGTTGNDQIGNYKYLNRVSPISIEVPYQGITALTSTELPNPYLQWEETKKLQLGLDLGFLNDRILLNSNYYRNRSSNQLQDYALPFITGFGSITQNFPALVENSGIELSVNTINIKSRNIEWTSNFNITFSKNKLVSYPNIENSTSASFLLVDKPITISKIYNYAGVDPTTGTYQFKDKADKLTSDPGFDDENKTVIIDTSPKYYGGFHNSINYKNFSLDILFQFVKQLGSNYFIGNRPGSFGGTQNRGNQPTSVIRRWRKDGDVSAIQRYSSDFSLFSQYIYALGSTISYTDASYIRLKNLSLSWQLPQSFKSWSKLQNGRIYMQAQNLLTLTKYNGLDPETKSSSSLPPLCVYTFGIQFEL